MNLYFWIVDKLIDFIFNLQMAGRDIESSISREFSGDIESAFKAIGKI